MNSRYYNFWASSCLAVGVTSAIAGTFIPKSIDVSLYVAAAAGIVSVSLYIWHHASEHRSAAIAENAKSPPIEATDPALPVLNDTYSGVTWSKAHDRVRLVLYFSDLEVVQDDFAPSVEAHFAKFLKVKYGASKKASAQWTKVAFRQLPEQPVRSESISHRETSLWGMKSPSSAVH